MKKFFSKKKIFALVFASMMLFSATAAFAAPVCPAYEDGHRFYNQVYLRQETQTVRHYPTSVGPGCDVTTTYNVYKKTCACGYSTPTGIIREKLYESHSVNHN
ncbi:hypothetical protein [Clostridium hydrogeniformans]|uniref:hypothetical protein n=1 Tax=Clostridium hydrogeniformans TaxID=349933 RepID=UPI00047F3409|nr:hypothetical protein [Clostridium hydrogeniformans]